MSDTRLVQNPDGTYSEAKQQPYCTVDFWTKEDFEYVQRAVKHYEKFLEENANKC